MKFKDAPIFIIASERSGTNLLRKRLTENQSHYVGLSPAHFLKHLYYRQPYYGDLSLNENFKKFVSDGLDLCLVHFAPWNINWSVEDILSSFGDVPRDAIHLMHYMMNRYAIEQGYDGYICKDNFLYEFALDISNTIPKARFIYLFRDPRDFVISQMKRPNAIKSVVRYSKLWQYEQTKAIAVAMALRSKNKCVFVSYENLIENEDKEIGVILSFFQLKKSRTKNYTEYNKEDVHEWANLSKDTIKNNKEKYLRELPKRKIAMVENICEMQMKYLGYEFFSDHLRNINRASLYFDMLFGFCHKKIRSFFVRVNKESYLSTRTKLLQRLKVNYRSDLF